MRGEPELSGEEKPFTLEDFIVKEQERLKEYARQKFGAPILRVEEGKVYDLTLDSSKEWRRVNTRFGERVAIPVIYEGQEYVVMANPNGLLYRSLVEQLARKLKETPRERIKAVHVIVKRVANRYTVVVETELVESPSEVDLKREAKKAKKPE
jgi:hypothetical protein